MNYIPYIFPVAAAVTAAVMAGNFTDYWFRYILGVAGAELIIFIIYYIASTCKQFLSGYAVRMVHENAWVEEVVHTVTETVNGEKRTRQKVEHKRHPDKWYKVLNTGYQITIMPHHYDHYRHLWGNEQHIDIYHSNLVSGGGGTESTWNGVEAEANTVTYTDRYRNPLRHSNSIFMGTKIKRKAAKQMGLFDYPPINEVEEQQVILRHERVACPDDFDSATIELQRLNAFCGKENEIHVFLLLFPADIGVGISQQQYDYWQSLNKNELVVCIGIDGDKVKWSRAMCWAGEPTELDTLYRDYFITNDTLRLTDFVLFMRKNINIWKRNKAKDYKYLGTRMSIAGNLSYWLISLIVSAIILYVALR